MLRHLRLGQPQLGYQIGDRAFPAGENVQDLPPPRLCHCVESIRGGRCSSQSVELYTHIGICQFSLSPKPRALEDGAGGAADDG